MIMFLLTFVTFARAVRRGFGDPEFRALFSVLAVVLAIGTVFYRFVEGWSWLDAFYFCVVTLATVGYGDLAPTTPEARMFTVFYIFLGIGLLAAFFSKLARNIRVGQRAHLRSRGPTGRRAPRVQAAAEPDSDSPAG